MLGGQTVWIVKDTPVLDGNGDPVLTEFMAQVTQRSEIRVDGCLFEIQDAGPSSAEQVAETTTTSHVGWCFMPVTADTRAITSRQTLRHGGHDYQVRGDCRIECDIDGVEDHVFVLCERQEG